MHTNCGIWGIQLKSDGSRTLSHCFCCSLWGWLKKKERQMPESMYTNEKKGNSGSQLYQIWERKSKQKLWGHNGFFVSYVHKSILIVFKISLKNEFQCAAFLYSCSRFNYHNGYYSGLEAGYFFWFWKELCL